MFWQKELIFLTKILEKCHIQSFLVDPELPLDERFDMGLRKLFCAESEQENFYTYFPNIETNTVYRVSDAFFCKYIFMLLPNTDKKTIYIIGPYVSEEINNQKVLEQSERLGLDLQSVKQLEYFYASIPYIKDENNLFAMVNTFGEYIWMNENNFTIVDVDCDQTATFLPLQLNKTFNLSNNESWDMRVMENRYEYENQLIEAVSQGQFHKAELILNSFSSLSFESRVTDRLRNIKNYCIIMNTLLRKAAEKGGVHPVYLDRVSSDYAKRIEQIGSVFTMPDFMHEMLRSYCRLVKKHSTQHYSPLVQKAIIKIESDLTADLSLSAMAELNNVSTNYFSGLFKKETGQTLTDYVNIKRIKLAKHLLKTTNLQIQTIAQHCGILDYRYFSKMFKKYEGKTPKEYRESPAMN